jgi:hypothetical protein
MLDANNRVQSRVLLPASARLGVTLWPCLYGSRLTCISEDYPYLVQQSRPISHGWESRYFT